MGLAKRWVGWPDGDASAAALFAGRCTLWGAAAPACQCCRPILPQLLATAEEERERHAEEAALLRRANEAAGAQHAADSAKLAEELRLRLDLQVLHGGWVAAQRCAGLCLRGCARSFDRRRSGGRQPVRCSPPACRLAVRSNLPTPPLPQHDKEELQATGEERARALAGLEAELARARADLARARADGLALTEDRARLEVGWAGLGWACAAGCAGWAPSSAGLAQAAA